MQNNRPFGVTIIAILAILGGIGSLVGGIALVAIIPFLGAALIIIGLAYFGVAYGLWKGLKWAWIHNIDSYCNSIYLGPWINHRGKCRSSYPGNNQCYYHLLSLQTKC